MVKRLVILLGMVTGSCTNFNKTEAIGDGIQQGVMISQAATMGSEVARLPSENLISRSLGRYSFFIGRVETM